MTEGGTIWQDADLNDNDVIFFHVLKPQSEFPDQANITLIALTTNNRYKRLRSSMQHMAEQVRNL